jgi:gamma-glutamylputrescine oxidase
LESTKIDFGWGGLIDISMNRMPDFGYAEIQNSKSGYAEIQNTKPGYAKIQNSKSGYADDSKRVLYAQGFSGSGVVATNAAARVIADAITGDTSNLTMFQHIQHTPFPGGKLLRAPVTAAGMLYHRMLDMF